MNLISLFEIFLNLTVKFAVIMDGNEEDAITKAVPEYP